MKLPQRMRKRRSNPRRRLRELRFENLERRRLLATTSVEASFKSFDVSASGQFSGSGPGDQFSGQASFSGQITYTSPTQGTGTGSGSGSGTGNDGCAPYAFAFAGNASIADQAGDLSHSDPEETDFRYTTAPCGGGVGGSLYRSDFFGILRTSDFSAELSSSAFGYTATWTGSVSFAGGAPDGQFAAGRFTDQGLQYDFTIGGGPANAQTHTTPVAQVTAYWSTGSDKLGPLHDPIDVFWNQAGGTVTAAELGTPPEDAAGVLLIFDEAGELPEGSSGESNNTLFVPFFSLDRVEAQYDDADDSKLTLGGFLPGVKLEQHWNLYFEGIDASALSQVQVSSPSLGTIQLQREGDAWKTPSLVDMGVFPQDAEINVRATSTSGLVVTDTFQIDLVDDPFDLEVELDVGGAMEKIEDIRLIDGFMLPNFTVNIPLAEMDLPLKADGDPYRNKLDVVLIGGGSEEVFRSSLFANAASLVRTLNGLPVGDLGLVVKASNVAGRQFRTRDVDLSDSETLLKINLPQWMGTPENKLYEAATHDYRFDLVLPSALQFNFAETLAEYGFFSGLASSLNAGADVTVVAPLVAPEEAKASIEFNGLVARATLLDQQLLNEELSAEDLGVNTEDSTLAARRFNDGTIVVKQSNEEGISIRDAGSSSGSLFDVGFGKENAEGDDFNQTMTADSIAKIKSLTDITLTPSLSFSGDFDSSLDAARLRYQLTFDAASAMILPESSYVKVTAGGRARASLSVGAGISFLGFDFLSASGTATVGASASVEAEARFAGSLTAPTVHSAHVSGTATVWSELAYSVEVLESEVVDDTIPLGSNTFSLFAAQSGRRAPEFENGTNFDLLQRSRMVADFPGVEATEGDSYGLLGSPDGSDPGNAALRFTEPVDGTVERLGYDARILANTSSLTPNRHFLETVLIGSEIVVDRVDLATINLSADDNPLGFSSGWQPRSGVPGAAIDPTAQYRLEYRLVTEPGDETVLVALDRLEIEQPESSLLVEGAADDVADGRLDFSAAQTTLHVSAASSARSRIRSITVSGSRIELADASQSALDLYPDDVATPIEFHVLDPNQDAFAVVTIESDDPQQPTREIELVHTVDGQRYDWHNYRNRMDVDANNVVAPLDVLFIINFLNANPPNSLPAQPGRPYLDVSQDNLIGPLDPLIIINYLNANPGGEGEASFESMARGRLDPLVAPSEQWEPSESGEASVSGVPSESGEAGAEAGGAFRPAKTAVMPPLEEASEPGRTPAAPRRRTAAEWEPLDADLAAPFLATDLLFAEWGDGS